MKVEKKLIDGVYVKNLKVIMDQRGKLFEMIRMDDKELLDSFGDSVQQVYCTSANPDTTKAWHFHKHQTDCFTCIFGEMLLVLADTREDSPTKGCINEFYMGVDSQKTVVIPPGVYHGFKCISTTPAIVVNAINKVYDCANPDEYRLPFNDEEIGYDWTKQNF